METRTTTTASAVACAATRTIHRSQEQEQQQQQRRRRRRCNSTAQLILFSVSSSYCCYSSTASEAYQKYTHHQYHHQYQHASCVLKDEPLGCSFLYIPRGGSTSSSSSSSSSGDEHLSSQDGEENKELDAYIESLIATVDDTSSEAEEALVEVEVEAELDNNIKAVDLPQSKESSPDESSSLVDDESSEQVAIETIQTTDNILTERNNPIIEEDTEEEEEDEEEEEEEEEEEGIENDEEEVEKEETVIEEEDDEEEAEEEEEEEEGVDNDDEEIDEEDEDEAEDSETLTAVKGNQQDDGEDDDESDNEVEEEDGREAPTAETDAIDRKQVIEKEQEDDNEDPDVLEEDSVVTNEPAVSLSTENDMQTSPKETMSRARPQPPNPVYLFLLRRGIVGHVLAMGLVLVVEWIQTYLPSLARFLAWLWFRLAPTRLQQGAPLPRRRRRPNPPTLAVRNPRTAQSGKMRKKLTQQADQQALAQLKRVGSVRDAKYRHVSMHFLQRHGLGPFAEATSSLTTPRTEDSLLKAGSFKTQDDAEEEDDTDWVMQALTKDKTDHQPKKSSLQPTVSIGIGSGGPSLSVGVEFGRGDDKASKDRRSSLIKAATTSTAPRKKRKATRASDRDGGSGVVGRIRAVTGANSRVSRSLFGAYPGDAVSHEEAASAKGVVELARKYGYGDWSEDDDDRDDEGGAEGKHRRVKSRRRRQHHSRTNPKGDDSWHSSSNTISAEWKSSSSSGDRLKRKHTHSRRSDSSSKTEDPDSNGGNSASHHSSRSSARGDLPNYPLASSTVLGKKQGGSYSANDLAKANTIRPAMERVRHVRRKASSKELKEDD